MVQNLIPIGINSQGRHTMKLTEKHREFAVKCFAKFMTRTETTNAFMQEFAHDLPPPPQTPN